MCEEISVRNLKIGSGMPKVIVPIVETNADSICERGKDFSKLSIDMIEWRADFYEDIFDLSKTMDTLKNLREAAGEKVILFTFRTKKEGGQKDISMEYYIELNTMATKSGCADLIDVEIFSGDDVVNTIVSNAHETNIFVVASNHDFFKTPPKDELIHRLQKMGTMKADILKIAVMPQSTDDVLELLAATNEMSKKSAKPIITMSMGATGTVSRLVGEVFGSAATFGAVGKTSAPGQIPVEKLSQVLSIINASL